MMYQLRSYQSFSWDLVLTCSDSGGIIATKKVPVGELPWCF